MITNESVRRLIATDRETLIDLMAVAYAKGGTGGGAWDVWMDPDIRDLLNDVRQRAATPERATISLERWNTEMAKL